MQLTFFTQAQQILVTGGTGFVGQHLIKALQSDGHQISVLTRNVNKAQALFKQSVQVVTDLNQLKQPMDVIINLAGARILGQRWTKARKAELYKSRVGLTEQLIAWIAQTPTKPKLLLGASAIGYYGIQAQGDNRDLTETSPPQAIFMSELVQAWEQANAQAGQYGVKVAVMRFGLVLGTDGGALPMMLLPIKLGLGGKMGSGQQWLSWIHIEDLVRATAHIATLNLNSEAHFTPYNFTSPQAVRQAEFTQIAAKLLHRPAFLPAPAFPVRLLLGEQADLLLEGQKVRPQALLSSHFQFRYPNLTDALQALLTA
jgi:hypothetical protein